MFREQETNLPPKEGILHLMEWAAEGKYKAPEVKVRAHDMRRNARQSSQKAGGLDEWTGKVMANAPHGLFEATARTWNICLRTGNLPELWTQVRNVAIEQEDGGDRWLLITMFVWRMGMSDIVAQLAGWIEEWAPKQLV
eukprot:5398799-Karenia_brevis.AAC.1